ncbi:MAG: DUF922 domain-containing protein [Rhizobiaceae bacterium]
MRSVFVPALVAGLLAASPPAKADWAPVERIETYPVAGATGIELYRSIGANGPKIGPARVIAYTDFKLTWRRDYRPQSDGSCKLVAATPKLIITYRLPKPSGRLPTATRARWRTFSEGIAAHEKVHGGFIVDMVRQIEALSIGFTHSDDPKCKRIYGELKKHLAALSQRQRARSRDFDRDEMSDGGNVHRLVLALINGG